MQDTEIRLECLKLAHRHDRSAEQVTTVASEYERFVRGGEDSGQPDTTSENQNSGQAQGGGKRRRGRGRPPKGDNQGRDIMS